MSASDFTYIDDIVEGVIRVCDRIPTSNVDHDISVPYCIYNIGNHRPVELVQFVEVLESCLGIKAQRNFLPLQPGDVLATYADITDLKQDVGFEPKTSIEVGLTQILHLSQSPALE